MEYRNQHTFTIEFAGSRRKFLYDISLGLGMALTGAVGASALASCGANSNEKRAEKTSGQKAERKLGIALVGLGEYSTQQLAPALKETQHCFLSAIVTGTPEKADYWKKKYSVPDKNVYNYENFDSIKDNPEVDIVYIVLPNGLHAEYAIRAARAGKHVICEKPMAITVEDCDRMIAASKEAGKMLSIGYRLHFEPHHKEVMRLGQNKAFGNLTKIKADNGMDSVSGWRLDKELAGGGPLMDLGIYCVQAARYTTGLEPIAVRAQESPKRDKETFSEVEEALSWQLEFPGGLVAECRSSYSESMNVLRADFQKGWCELSPAYTYSGIKGETGEGSMEFEKVNQQALQMDDFALAIKENRPTPVPGEMGRQDVKILQAIYKAMETGERVEIV